MPRIAYTRAQKAEAVALAVTAGAEYAAEQLGMDVRTVRAWAAKAGKAPELAAPETGWRSVLDLAMARVSAALSSGSVSPVAAATIAGIASRNSRESKATDPVRAQEEIDARRRERYGLAHIIVRRMEDRMALESGALMAELEARYGDPAVESYVATCLQRYHQLHDCLGEGVARSLPPCPEPLVDPWAWIDSLGYLDEWLDRSRQEERERQEAAMAKIRAEREAAQVAALNAETRALVDAAEAWLKEANDVA